MIFFIMYILYKYMYLDICEASHIHNLWIYTLFLSLFFLFSPIPVFWSSFVINLYWCFFSFFMSGMKFRQTDMFCACNDDQRPCVAYVWFVVILSFLFFCAPHAYYSLFFLYVDCSSYFMYKIRYVLDKRKEFILARKMSKWDYYYYYCLVSVNI